MDIIIPIGVVIYILVSVLGAVLKSLNSPGNSSPRSPRPVSSPFPTLEQMFGLEEEEEETKENERGMLGETTYVEQAETYTDTGQVVEDVEVIADEFESADSIWEGEQSEDFTKSQGAQEKSRSLGLGRLNRQAFRRAIIMSEIVRKPRAMRRWPDR